MGITVGMRLRAPVCWYGVSFDGAPLRGGGAASVHVSVATSTTIPIMVSAVALVLRAQRTESRKVP